jgi:L-seryl-tRNA(Ser) seleniumtransferase
MSNLRNLPSVDHLLSNPSAAQWIASYGRELTVEAVRAVLEDARRDFPASAKIPEINEIETAVAARLTEWTAPSLLPVINAAGVILHTNLGRAPLSAAAMRAAAEVGAGYSTLEFDLQTGKRGSRLIHAEALLQRLTGAQAALVVNNNAAAALLALSGLAVRRKVVIARSQLVEIGGGFRIPDVMKQSGAKLLEVGATNRVHLADFEAALAERPAAFLRAHRSNFQITGFVSEPSLAELAALAHQAGLPLIDDLGSGALLDTARFGLAHEPTVQESIAAGADLICFSGDKLLGGPQAGILIGRVDLITKLKKHPLARAVRADKLCLAALSATLLHYLKDEAEREIPVWRMIAAPLEEIERRACAWQAAIGRGEVIPGLSTIGGGSLPGETLPTRLLALNVRSADRFLGTLRRAHPPVIARTDAGRVLLDPRTVLPEQEADLLNTLKALPG